MADPRDICEIHTEHRPNVLVEDDHHIIPQSWCLAAGRPIDPVTVDVGPTCHANVHYALDLLVKYGRGNVPWDLWRHVGKAERECALDGYSRAVEMGLTPKATL